MSNRVTHFEIPTDHPDKSMQFFAEVFQWKFQQFGDNDYWLVKTGSDDTPGIDGAIIKKKDPNHPLTHSIQVFDIDKTIFQVEHSGGQIVVPKMPIPGVGWLSYFKDLDGNIHGIWQDEPSVQ